MNSLWISCSGPLPNFLFWRVRDGEGRDIFLVNSLESIYIQILSYINCYYIQKFMFLSCFSDFIVLFVLVYFTLLCIFRCKMCLLFPLSFFFFAYLGTTVRKSFIIQDHKNKYLLFFYLVQIALVIFCSTLHTVTVGKYSAFHTPR